MKRRILLTGLMLAGTAAASFAQGKKGGGGDAANLGDMGAPLLGVDGRYSALGRNPNGSEYQGRCDVVQQGDALEFTWTVGTSTYQGSGVIEGRVVTIDWGADDPVVYVVMENGALHGTWADGTALERLSPL